MRSEAAETTQRKKLLTGILLMLSAALGFACMSACVKLSGDLPAFQKVFFRNLIAVPFALFLLLKNREKISCRKENAVLLLLRCILGVIGVAGNYYALNYMMLSDVAVIVKLSPFVTLIVSSVLLGETFRLPQGLAVLAAFAGSVIVSRPGFREASFLPFLAAIASAFGAGSGYVCVRMLQKRGESSNLIILAFSCFSCLFCIPIMLGNYHPMEIHQLLLLVAAGVFACFGQFCMTYAYKYAASREISAVEYSQVIFAAVLSKYLFGQVPDLIGMIGYIIIFGAIIFNSIYSRRLLPAGSSRQ